MFYLNVSGRDNPTRQVDLSAVTIKLFPSTLSVYIDGKNIIPKCFPIPQLIILCTRNEPCHTSIYEFQTGVFHHASQQKLIHVLVESFAISWA